MSPRHWPSSGAVAGIALALVLGSLSCGPDDRVELRVGDQVSAARGAGGQTRTYPMAMTSRDGTPVEVDLDMTLVGTVDSPVVDGIVLQATDVQWRGHHVIASYNVRGDAFLGALQIVDAADPADPRVLAEAIYRDTDLSKICVSGSRVVAAGADRFDGGTLELFTLDEWGLSIDEYLPLGSFASTFVALSGQRAWVTYGDRGGGVAVVDVGQDRPELDARYELLDARWVNPLPEDRMVVVAGSPGRVLRYDELFGEGEPPTSVIEVDGANVGAPTWGTRRDDLLFLSADEAGLLVYDLSEMRLLAQLQTSGTANGSALSVDGRFGFLANGEEGLVAVDLLDPADPVVLADIDVADDGGSANAVDLRNNVVALADGRAGVKLIAYERRVQSNEGDCDGDGLWDEEDVDDDDDGILDQDDAARCNPDAVCEESERRYEGRFIGEFYNLPCDHPDVEGPITGVVTGTLPWERDWYDERYYSFTLERDSLIIDYAEDYFPVDEGLCGDPFYFATYWYTTAIASEGGTYTFELGSDDDGWLFIDGELIIDIGGIHPIRRQSADVELTAGPHRIEIYFAERHVVQSGLEFDVAGYPSETARLELVQQLCLDGDGDADGDGVPNDDDIAPLTR